MRRVILLAVLSASAIYAAGGDLRLIQAAKKADVKEVGSLWVQEGQTMFFVSHTLKVFPEIAAYLENTLIARGMPVEGPRPEPTAPSAAQ